MRKLFVTLFIITITLQAHTLQELQQMYQKQEYKKTYAALQNFLENNPTDIKAISLLGDCAYKLNDFDDAMAIYDRVLILDEKNIYAKMQEAKIYIKTNNNKLANLELYALENTSLTKEQKKEFLSIKNTLSKKVIRKKDKIFRGRIALGLLHDTNSNGDIGEKGMFFPAINLNYQGDKKRKDFAHFENLKLLANLKSKDNKGILARIDAYNKSYFKSDNNDLSYVALNLSPYYNFEGYQLVLPLSANKIFKDKKSYLNTYGIGIDFKKSMDDILFEVGYRFFLNKYYNPHKGKNYKNHNLYAGLQSILSQNILTHAYLRYSHAKETKDLRTDVSYNSYGLSLGAKKEFLKNYTLYANIDFDAYNYTDVDRILLKKRADRIFDYNIGLSYRIFKSSYVNFDLHFIDKQSNHVLYDYNKLLSSVKYEYRF